METAGDCAGATGKCVAWTAQVTLVLLVVAGDYEKGCPRSFSLDDAT